MTYQDKHWLERVDEVASSLVPDDPAEALPPVTFLLGAGASLSSGGPQTETLLRDCQRKWEGKFPDNEAVYRHFSTALTASEREAFMRHRFKGMGPYVGYRCLAAMARSRPVFVVNLNWDNCVKLAGDRVGVPVRLFDLQDVAEGRKAVEEVREHGSGIACAHVHGFFGNKRSRPGTKDEKFGIKFRFAAAETHAFEAEEMKLLRELLGHFTIVAGTSLEGPGDARELLEALVPGEQNAVHPLWIFERGPARPSLALDGESERDRRLYDALNPRNSHRHFIANPDVDFDAMLAALRGAEVDLPWRDVKAEAGGRLPSLPELIPPNPDEVRPLLDAERSLVVGAPRVGASTLAYLIAWWRCLTDLSNGRRRVKGLRRADQALEYLGGDMDEEIGAVVLDDLFDERELEEDEVDALSVQLADALARLRPNQVAIATASPDGTMAALCRHSRPGLGQRSADHAPLGELLTPIIARAGTLWREDDLRAWARARAADRSELVCREVRMGLVTTPSQAVRMLKGQTPHELEAPWHTRLRAHLDNAYPYDGPGALLLAILRLQDFSIPRPERTLKDLSGTALETLSHDPWGFCTPIGFDGECHLRLSHAGVVQVVDKWMADGEEALADRLRNRGEEAHWAVAALKRWHVYRGIGEAPALPEDQIDVELFGSEFVKRAMQEQRLELALEALGRMWKATRDHWSAKDVALDLVTHWEKLKRYEPAWDLRDELLDADDEFGTYALFEALLRMGRPAPPGLWPIVVAKVVEFAGPRRDDVNARRQVALCFDAILWRRCPISHKEEKALIDDLLAAAREDDLLLAAFVTACGYHFQGAAELRREGFDLPANAGATVRLDEAQEMAWLVAWHFVHQSRCRAAVSRRTFLSTKDAFVETGAPRYLDRSCRQDPLDAEHERAVVQLARALARHPETAGWGLHLVMNVHATNGIFELPADLNASFQEHVDPDNPGEGVISAMLSYMPSEGSRDLLEPVIDSDRGKQAFLRGLGEGVPVAVEEGTGPSDREAKPTWVVEPRFVMSANPWETRHNWGADPHLPGGGTNALPLIEELDAVAQEEVSHGELKPADRERVLRVLRRGDTSALEMMARQRNLKRSDYVDLLVHVHEYLDKQGYAG